MIDQYYNFINESNSNPIDYYVSKMNDIHGGKYDYPNIDEEFMNSSSKITIHCKKCGDIFQQTISHHIWSRSGCPNCYGNKKNTIEKILKGSKDIHGEGRYSYPNIDSENISSYDRISIFCNKCGGTFNQSIHSHLNKKNGCNRCSKSKMENLIENYLISNSIHFMSQHKFEKCIYKKPLPFDFYLPEKNTCIEYDGEQHYISRRDDVKGEYLTLQKLKDEIKSNFCLKNNINLERISYKDNLSNKLKYILNKIGIDEVVCLSDVVMVYSKKESKVCSVCDVDKNINDFNRSSRSTDGYKSYCKSCSSEMGKNYYKNNIKK